jgi:hypothetical protein
MYYERQVPTLRMNLLPSSSQCKLICSADGNSSYTASDATKILEHEDTAARSCVAKSMQEMRKISAETKL